MAWNEEKELEAALSFQRGEEKGFRFFFDKLYYQLNYYAFTFTKDKILAEDAVETAFVRLWEYRKELSHPKVIKSWLFTTVRNECLSCFAASQRRQRLDGEILEWTSESVDSQETCMIKRELYRQLYSRIDELPDACRRIFLMYYIYGISVKEICEKLGLTKSTIKNQKARGMKLMRSKYSVSDEIVSAKEYRWVRSIFMYTNSPTQRGKLYGLHKEHVRLIRSGRTFCEITNKLLLEAL